MDSSDQLQVVTKTRSVEVDVKNLDSRLHCYRANHITGLTIIRQLFLEVKPEELATLDESIRRTNEFAHILKVACC